LAERIAEASDRNLRKAILMLESTKVKQYPFQPDQLIEKADWEEFILQLAKEIAEEQSPKKLMVVRAKLYELLSHCIPPELIIRVIILLYIYYNIN
jgi:replication factor C subunit 3/5